jgi:DNA-binding CsgD family transcriptional regulator
VSHIVPDLLVQVLGRCNTANVAHVSYWGNCCERVAVNWSVSPTPSAPCGCHAPHFTEHELLILSQVAAGATNEEIAASMNLSNHTVAWHLRNMLSRSQARNRAELTARAYAAGVLVSQTWPPELSGRRCLKAPAAPPGPRAPGGHPDAVKTAPYDASPAAADRPVPNGADRNRGRLESAKTGDPGRADRRRTGPAGHDLTAQDHQIWG